MLAARPWASTLRLEDGVLAIWLGLVSPIAASLARTAPLDGPVAGAAIVVACILAVVCLGTRPADQPPVHLTEEADAPRWILAGPLLGGMTIVSSTGFDQLGFEGTDLGGVMLLVSVATTVLNRWLPVAPALVRRLLVLPFMLVASSFFSEFSASVIEGIDVAGIVHTIGTPEWGLTVFVLTMLVGGLAAFYAMLIVAPRQLADPEDRGPRWLVRFALFLVASLTGIGWLTLAA